jgi:hypothetical protein
MRFNPSTLVTILSLAVAAPVLAEPAHRSSLPSIRRSLASKLERRAQKIERQNNAQNSLSEWCINQPRTIPHAPRSPGPFADCTWFGSEWSGGWGRSWSGPLPDFDQQLVSWILGIRESRVLL